MSTTSSSIPRLTKCPCCGNAEFTFNRVLWPELIQQWGLSEEEVAYIDRQQGLQCGRCSANLRSMNLAQAILSFLGFSGTMEQFVKRPFRQIRVLEINEAGSLSPLLRRLSNHVFGQYPEVDMTAMPYSDRSFDLVVHSDTLEHVPDPMRALEECRRVLKPSGACAYTIPIIVGRLSRSRDGLPKSYHGSQLTDAADWAVRTEYGADAWAQIIRAGFSECRISSLEFPLQWRS
jgi:SAM-dependent methyltransferase